MTATDRGTYKSYFFGLLASLFFTLTAYFLVSEKLLQPLHLTLTILTLAVLQAIIQLLYFLHLADEKKPRWNLHFLLFMVSVLIIVVFGSLWIMYHLNYNMMH